MVNKHFTVVWGMVLMLSMIVLFGCDNLPTIDLSSDAPPDAPIDFQATPGDGQVTLKWTSPSNTGIKDGVTAAISGYKVYWSTESDVKSGGSFEGVGNITSYTVEKLDNGTKYYFAVSAINLVAEGELSDEVSATPSANAAGDRAPDAPTGLQATAGDGRVDLSWNAPDNTGTAGGTKAEITHYLVYKSTSSGNLKTGETKRVESGTSAIFDGLANGTTFYFAVSAVNSVGEGALSNEVSAMPTANAPGDRAPDAPTDLRAVAGDGRVDVSWSAPVDTGIKGGTAAAISKYVVYWSNSPGNIETSGNSKAVTSGTSTVVDNLANDMLYYFAANAFNAAGESALSNVASATPEAGSIALGVPTGLRVVSSGEDSITLAWDAVSGAEQYEVKRDGSILSQIITGTSFTDIGLDSNREYEYSVRAKTSTETSDWSSSIPGSTNLSVPPPPDNLRVTGTTSANSISLAWDAVPGATLYELQRNGSKVYEGTETSFIDNSGLSSGTSYSYRVRAKNSAGFGTLSGTLSESTASPPDLILRDTRVSTASVLAGETFKIYTTVDNIGGSTSASAKIRYYRSTDSSIDSSDTYEDYDNASSYPSNENESITAPDTPGTYYYGAIVDTVAGEINTTNNGSSGIRVEVTKRPISGSFSYSSISVSKGNSDYEYPSWSGASSGQDVEYNISPSVSGVTISRSSGKVSVSSSASVMSRSFTITATGTDNYTGSITGSIYVDVSKPHITGSFSYSSISVSKGNSDYEYPSWSGASSGQDVEYSISPTVSGVTIIRSSGKVSVSSSASVMSESFTITATGTGNYTGSITGSIYVDVSKPYITGTLSYNSINIAAGYATSMQPNWSGVTSGQTVEYSISPYKSGITIDKYTGVISVAADTNSGYNDYTVTAEGTRDYQGRITAELLISIDNLREMTAPILGFTKTYDAVIDFYGDADWFYIDVGWGFAWQITIESTGNLDIEAELFHDTPDLSLYASNSDSGDGKNFKLTLNTIPSGRYILRVWEYRNDSTGDYTIKVRRF